MKAKVERGAQPKTTKPVPPAKPTMDDKLAALVPAAKLETVIGDAGILWIGMPSLHRGTKVEAFRVASSDLVSIAGSKPTAFQAVGFEQPVLCYENRRNGGIQAKRARGIRFEVSPDLVHEISEKDIA